MLQQGTEEWLEWRRKNIGASDAPIIMGASKWKTPYELWLYKTYQADEPPMNRWMQRGKDLEPEARAACEKELGIDLFPQCLTSKKMPFMVASLDGISLDGDVAVEIKCPGHTDHQCALNGKVPDHYIWQLQHQMYVSELDYMFYYSCDGSEGKLLYVIRDDEKIKALLEACIKFKKCVDDKVSPGLCDRDRLQITDGSLARLERELIDCIQNRKEAEQREEAIRAKILSQVSTNVETDRMKITKYTTPGRIDYSKVPQLEGVDLETYRGESKECWKITIK